jgi:exodeoxyribonuclease VIII
MKHIMIDLETLGFRSNAVILSIGAVFFEPMTGEIGETFKENIEIGTSVEAGRTIDADIVSWWFKQGHDAFILATENAIPFKDALSNFADFVKDDPIVWGNGPTFDIIKLETGYEHFFGAESYPWYFRDVRCVRTMRDLTADVINRDDVTFDGTKHDSLSDAIWQAKYVSIMYQTIKERLTNV